MCRVCSTKQNIECQTGKASALPCETGDLPLSGGLASPFCSNMARRFLTALMVAILKQALQSS
jgi:hypothetical protein